MMLHRLYDLVGHKRAALGLQRRQSHHTGDRSAAATAVVFKRAVQIKENARSETKNEQAFTQVQNRGKMDFNRNPIV